MGVAPKTGRRKPGFFAVDQSAQVFSSLASSAALGLKFQTFKLFNRFA